jgi:hypothetical protein
MSSKSSKTSTKSAKKVTYLKKDTRLAYIAKAKKQGHDLVAEAKERLGITTNPSCQNLKDLASQTGFVPKGFAIGEGHVKALLKKNAKKAGKKGSTTKVAAKVTKATPAKVYRRANGTIAPKEEYAVRAKLEAKGLTRKQVDKRTAKAMRELV